MLSTTIIRAFDGSLADAEGLLIVEKATFDESPYTPEQVQAMLSEGSQRAWLALSQEQVVGFVTAFCTAGLRGPCWEIDLLAVHPDWAGQGLATRLIQAAGSLGPPSAPFSRAQIRSTRAVVATNNQGSARAFMRAGFRRAERCKLLIFRPKEQRPLSWVVVNISVREVEEEELTRLTVIASAAKPVSPSVIASETTPPPPSVIASEAKQSPSAKAEIATVAPLLRNDKFETAVPAATTAVGDDKPNIPPGQLPCPGPTLLLTEDRGQPLGYTELLEVQTLLYQGIWIESLVASTPVAYTPLVHEALNRAAAADLDEIGMMVPEHDRAVQDALRAAGFRSLGSFDWFRAALPLPGLASSAEDLQGTLSREGHV